MVIEYGLADILSVLCITGWTFMISVHIIAIVYGRLHLYKVVEKIEPEHLPGVSIIKPVVGEDGNSYKNFQSFFELSYTKYEILFCVPNDHDPAISTIEKLRESYPNVDARIFKCAFDVGVNPKVNNMMQGYTMAKYDLILISDSSIQVLPDSLQEMVSHLQPNIAIVHQMPFVTNADGFGSCLEKVYFGTQHARVYLFTNFMQLQCVNGMASLIDKKLLEEIGGLQSLGEYIAEDYYMAKELHKRGYRFALSTLPALQNPESRTVARFKDRMIRWTRLRLTMEPFPQCLEPLTECFVIGLLMALGVNHFTGRSILLTLLQHCLLWAVMDQLLLVIVQGPNGALPSFWWRLIAWFFRETFTHVFFLQAAFGRSIAWRNGKFDLSVGGKAKLTNHNIIKKCTHNW